MKYAVNIELTA